MTFQVVFGVGKSSLRLILRLDLAIRFYSQDSFQIQGNLFNIVSLELNVKIIHFTIDQRSTL